MSTILGRSITVDPITASVARVAFRTSDFKHKANTKTCVNTTSDYLLMLVVEPIGAKIRKAPQTSCSKLLKLGPIKDP